MDDTEKVMAGDLVADRLRPIADIYGAGDRLATGALVGSRCEACGAMAFPVRDVCMTCGGRAMAKAALPTKGNLYSHTTVHVSASRPTPYAIGYVDLEGGVRVLSAIEGAADRLVCGATMRLAIRGDDWLFVPEDDR